MPPVYQLHYTRVNTSNKPRRFGFLESLVAFLLRLFGVPRSGEITLTINAPYANQPDVGITPLTGSGTVSPPSGVTVTAYVQKTDGTGRIDGIATTGPPNWAFTFSNPLPRTAYVMFVNAQGGNTGVGAVVQFTTGS
jgi:hypothetical protein